MRRNKTHQALPADLLLILPSRAALPPAAGAVPRDFARPRPLTLRAGRRRRRAQRPVEVVQDTRERLARVVHLGEAEQIRALRADRNVTEQQQENNALMVSAGHAWMNREGTRHMCVLCCLYFSPASGVMGNVGGREAAHLEGRVEGAPQQGRVSSFAAAGAAAHLLKHTQQAARDAILRAPAAAPVPRPLQQQPHAEPLTVEQRLQHNVEKAVVLSPCVRQPDHASADRARQDRRGGRRLRAGFENDHPKIL